MKTEQEQIKEIKQIIDERVETTLGQVQGRHDNVIKTVDTIIIAQDIIDAGYGDVSEYKAEIERLNKETSDIRKKTAEEFAKRTCEMLWNLGIDKDGNRFSYGDLTSENVLYIAKQFGVDIDDRVCKENNIATSHINRLVEQDKENKKLKEEINNLKADFDSLQESYEFVRDCDAEHCLEINETVKQAQIDVLNKVKERAGLAAIETYHICNLIDELIKEVQAK